MDGSCDGKLEFATGRSMVPLLLETEPEALLEYWDGADDGKSEDGDDDAPCDRIDGGNWVESGKLGILWWGRDSLWMLGQAGLIGA